MELKPIEVSSTVLSRGARWIHPDEVRDSVMEALQHLVESVGAPYVALWAEHMRALGDVALIDFFKQGDEHAQRLWAEAMKRRLLG